MKWQKKLTKKQIQHINQTTSCGSLREFRRNREYQISERKKGGLEPCFECKAIAFRLGIA
jgi:hypothetical protein